MGRKKDADVPDTRFRKQKHSVTRRDPASDPPTALELQSRIPCPGKTAAQVLDEVKLALSEAEARNLNPLIVLEDLGRLADSVATLIKGLCRILVGYPRAVSFWETSGYSEAIFNVMELQDPSAG